jgi:DNA-binding HxlR family transcriptional regulator
MTEQKEKLPTWCSGEDWCPLTATANIVSKKWHPVIIHRLLEEGGMGFNELKDEVGGISSKVLSESLEDLEEKRIINREVISEKPFRVKYKLTERGENLRPAIREMINWGEENLCEASTKEKSVV